MAEGRRTFGPVVLAGLGGAGLAALAGHRPWAAADPEGERAQGLARVAESAAGAGESPAAGALALVALASWGLLLVTRGRPRRLAALLAALAAAGVLAAVATGWTGVPADLRDALVDLGVSEPEVGRTAWAWLAPAGALLALAAALAAVRLAPTWPEMGRRYDSPTGPGRGPSEGGERSSVDLWKAMDEGEDPTV